MATRHVLADLSAAAEAAGLPRIEIESLGGVDAAKRVADGEALDLVFLATDALRRLAADGHVEPGSITPLVLSQVAVGVPSGSDEPAAHAGGLAFADASGMRDALRSATRIGYSTGPSGTALVEMIGGWGLGEELGERLVQARAGVPVARSLAEGEVDLGFQQLSELVGQPGVRILGVLPPDCAIDTIFAGAVAATASDPAVAREALAFLGSEAVAPIVEAHSFARARA
jgi:molybdate transport system substrate-binding protein